MRMKTLSNIRVPHPFPYQGSKRGIAKHILRYFPAHVPRLIEPFCGSGAVSIAAAAANLAERFMLNDLNAPLIALWSDIIERPQVLYDEYERQWLEQQADRKRYFFIVREDFNRTHNPRLLLYLLARIVKGSVRYNGAGEFNQSADNRRLGMHPNSMRRNIYGVSELLNKKTSMSALDFRQVLDIANKHDLVYMDPPYQGTSSTRDHRYFNGLSYTELVDALFIMNDLQLSYIISYDGMTGAKKHGNLLPNSLKLQHLQINAGRSSQATLLGNSRVTIESLYLSPCLIERLAHEKRDLITEYRGIKQQELALI